MKNRLKAALALCVAALTPLWISALVGCSSPTNGDQDPDKTALNTAITAASAAKTGVAVSAAASNVPIGTKWVTQAEMDALDEAINAAQAVAANTGATQAEVNAAASALDTAIATFIGVKKEGAKNTAALDTAISEAETAKTGVVISAAAANVPVGTKWVTQAEMDALDAAIDAAEAVAANAGATQAEVNNAASDLTAATAAFRRAGKAGTSTQAREDADAFTADHGTITAKIVDTVTVADKEAVDAALAAYNGLSAAAKTLLPNDTPAKLQALLDRIDALEAQAAFTAAHGAITAKTVDTVAAADKAAVNAALAAYNALSDAAKALLPNDTLTKLQALLDRIDALEDQAGFTAAHGTILAKTVDTVTVGDKTAANAALAAYDELSVAAKALLPNDTLAKLQALVDRIDALEDQAAFTAAHGAILTKTVATVDIGDKAAVTAALAAYNELSDAAKALLPNDTLTKLQALLAKINEDEAPTVADEFTADHGAILAKTVATVTIADKAAVTAALAAYNALNDPAKDLLPDDTLTKLQALLAKINELEAQAAADAFTIAHGATVNIDINTVDASHGEAIDAAIAAYNALSNAARALLPGDTLAKLQALWSGILGTKTINLTFDGGALTAGNTENLSIDRSDGETLTVTAATGLTDIQWSLNGAEFSAPWGTTSPITIAAADYPAGKYLLGIAAKKDGVDCSAVVTFTVVE